MITSSYNNLMVWLKAMDLTVETYSIIKKLPQEEKYSLCDQMRRSAVSIPSNIAEGHERGTKKEFTHFLLIARGSKAELETQLQICVRIGYITEQDISVAMSLLKEIGSMLTSLISKLKTKN